MISSTTIVTSTLDSRLALQTTAAYFAIRQSLPLTLTIPSSSQNGSGNRNGGLPKSALEYTFLALVVFIIVCVVIRRYRLAVQRQRAASSNLNVILSSSRRYHSYRIPPPPVELQHLHSDGQPYPPYSDPHLRGFPAAYMGYTRPRTHATDIDSSGRRLGDLTVEMDHDGELGIKDDLPAYDNLGGPPRYLELEMQSRNRPPPNGNVHSSENANNSLQGNDNSREVTSNLRTAQQLSQPENSASDTSHLMPRLFHQPL